MFHCILGALLASCASSGNITIPGKVGYAAPGQAYAWNYAAYYGVPVLNSGPLVIPAYANEVPIVFPTTPGLPAATTNRGYRS
jgi:hypothetical protein